MEPYINDIVLEVDALLKEGYRMWEGYGLPCLSEEEKHVVTAHAAMACKNGVYVKEFAAACQCFYLFRILHAEVEEAPETATLLGDYFFSRFSHYLIPIDSTRLIERFSEYLKQDVLKTEGKEKGAGRKAYLDFVTQTAEDIGL